MALPVYNVEEPKMPLLLARSRNLFKLFQSDIGLLTSQYAEGIQMRIIKGDKDINFGSIYENAVAQELVAHGIVPYYYNNKKRGELDFVIELESKVLPIEVKSGKDYETHRALSNIMDCEEYDLPKQLSSITVICASQVRLSTLRFIWRCSSRKAMLLRLFIKWIYRDCKVFYSENNACY